MRISTSASTSRQPNDDATQPTPLSQLIGRSRYVVLVAVVAVLLVAISLFLIGTISALVSLWDAWVSIGQGDFDTAELTVGFLELVSVMLKAVVFYIIGVGLYSLFIAPLNLTVALGVETLNDLEAKVVSVVIVILGVTFLEHFISWVQPLETLMFGGAMALVVGSLVLFQRYNHQAKEDQKHSAPDVHARAQKALFQEDEEEHVIQPEDVAGRERK
ncbi:MAG: YqhA family protein [Chloroflexaceae bacterium]|jgi:uncharacterized membrane protein YqhA|nr:YqhA family protein [Chloroflexaceae bacterium]